MGFIKEFKETFRKSYGSVEKQDKGIFLFTAFFFIVATALLILFILFSQSEGLERLLDIYIIVTTYVTSLFTFSIYFYSKQENSNRFIHIKQMFTKVSLILLVALTSPILLIIFVLYRMNFITIIKHFIFEFFSTIISTITSPIIGIVSYVFLSRIHGINAACIAITITLFSFLLIILLCEKIYFMKCECDHKQFQKEIYVLSFVFIAIATMACYFFVIQSELKDNILASFAIYLAFDQIHDKWIAMDNKKDM
jgi:hypothetical protein